MTDILTTRSEPSDLLEMEVLELVDNEPTARAFKCNWETCGKVRTRALGRPPSARNASTG